MAKNKQRDEALTKALEGTDQDETQSAESDGSSGDTSNALVPKLRDGSAQLSRSAEAGLMTKEELTAQAQRIAQLSGKEQLEALEEALDIDEAEIDTIASGSLAFWPAFPGAILVGTIQNRNIRKTKMSTKKNPDGLCAFYTVRIEKQAALAATLDGEISELPPGDLITVLERSVLGELQTRIGQQVAILCCGLKKGQKFNYWDYKIVGKKRTPQEVQAAALLAMSNIQAKQLPPASTDSE